MCGSYVRDTVLELCPGTASKTQDGVETSATHVTLFVVLKLPSVEGQGQSSLRLWPGGNAEHWEWQLGGLSMVKTQSHKPPGGGAQRTWSCVYEVVTSSTPVQLRVVALKSHRGTTELNEPASKGKVMWLAWANLESVPLVLGSTVLTLMY